VSYCGMFSVEATNSQINFPVSFFLVNINESILVYWGSRKCCQQNKMEQDRIGVHWGEWYERVQ
jgi:hypothetical protein